MVVLNGCMALNVQRMDTATCLILRYLTCLTLTNIRKRRDAKPQLGATISSSNGLGNSLNPAER